MMKHVLKQVSCLAFLFIFLSNLVTPSARAESGADYSIEISQKFGRGLLNVLSSPLEIPCGIRDEVAERGTGGIGIGLFKGIALMARRILVGVTEAGTFMIPMPPTLPSVCAERPEPSVEKI